MSLAFCHPREVSETRIPAYESHNRISYFGNYPIPATSNYSHAGVFCITMNKITNSLLVLAVGGMMLSASAQTAATAGPGAHDPGHPRVNQVNRRQTRQQKRIAQGINNGSLNPKEAAHLEKREASVQRQEQRDMAKHNGHLTKAEQRQLNRRENRISHSIYQDKHNNK